jgi:hypothetical protein
MPQVRIKKAFLHKGETIQPGTVMLVPDHALEALGDFAEVLMLSPADLEAQQKSTDWRQFCDNHENNLPDSYCTLKRDKSRDPFTNCVGYQLKNGRTLQ